MRHKPSVLELTDGEGFAAIPKVALHLLRDGKVTFAQFSVFAVMVDRAGYHSSKMTLQIGALKLGSLCGKRSRYFIYKAWDALEEVGLIRCISHDNGHSPLWELNFSKVAVEASKSLPSVRRQRKSRRQTSEKRHRNTCGHFATQPCGESATPTSGESATPPVAESPHHLRNLSKNENMILKNIPKAETKSAFTEHGHGNGSVAREKPPYGPRSKELFKLMRQELNDSPNN